MTPPGTFERVYAAIKQRLRQGFYRPGQRIEPAALSEDLNASVTPVRDALHRLTGERLVEAPRHEGFRVPMLTESMLRQLYAWHRDLVLLALMNHDAQRLGRELESASGVSPDASVLERQNALFTALVQSAGNSEHSAALEALRDRLQPVQQLEELFLDALDAETADIVEALRTNDRRGVRRSLFRYHRRREKLVPALLARLLGTVSR